MGLSISRLPVTHNGKANVFSRHRQNIVKENENKLV